MLQVKMKVGVLKGCAAMLLTDTTGDYSATNPEGYGGPNTSRAAISKVRVIIQSQHNIAYELSSAPLGPDYAWTIHAKDLEDGVDVTPSPVLPCDECNENWGNLVYSVLFPYGVFVDCPPTTDLKKKALGERFGDMCYKITYEVYSKTQIPALVANYIFLATYHPDRFVFARVNGAWYDVTDQCTVNDGKWTFVKEGTANRYDRYEVRDHNDNVFEEGVILVEEIEGVVPEGLETPEGFDDSDNAGAFFASSEHTLVSARTIEMPVLCIVEHRMQQAMYKLSMNPEEIMSSVSEAKALDLWSLAYARLQSLVLDPECGCDNAMEEAASINTMLEYLFGNLANLDCYEC